MNNGATPSRKTTPDGPPLVSDRIRFDHKRSKIQVFTGKVELGQHLHHAVLQLASDGLGIAIEHLELMPVSTTHSPNEGVTAGSLSIEYGGTAVYAAAYMARQCLLAEAAQRLSTESADIVIDDLCLRAVSSGASSPLFECAKSVELDVGVDRADFTGLQPSMLGTTTPNPLFEAIADGTQRFIQDFELPEMLHARAIRGAGRPLRVDVEGLRELPNVCGVVHKGGFVAIVCEQEHHMTAAADAAAKLIEFDASKDTGCDGPVSRWIRERKSAASVFTHGDATLAPGPGPSHSLSVSRPFLLHGSIAPSCALARYRDGRLDIWTHSQGIFSLRTAISLALGLSEKSIDIHHIRSAGCYGHNAADDAAMDAALIALETHGVPVRVVWPRIDDMCHAPLGAPMWVNVKAAVDLSGAINFWSHEIWSGPHAQRPSMYGNVNLLGAMEVDPTLAPVEVRDVPTSLGGGAGRNAQTPYQVPGYDIAVHLLQDLLVRTSALRSLGAHLNVVAIEAMMDDLAVATDQDPIGFRLRHLSDERARGTLERLQALVSEAHESLSEESHEIGVAYSRYKNRCAYAAVAAEVELDYEPRVTRIWVVVDAGLIVNPLGVRNQLEGGIIQAVSWTLREKVLLHGGRPDIQGWRDYPITAIADAPEIIIELVRWDKASGPLGVGECMQGPVSAAISNGIARILDVRIADLPIDRDAIIAAVTAAE